MELLPLIIQLVSGAIGGNLAGNLMKKFSMGTLWNSVLGIIGGGLGGQLLDMAGIATQSGMDLTGILGSIAGGGVGGGALLAIAGVVKNAMGK
jgi:uncharacterized membrane protein YeaQ/YmgE (transglycosylase-associated protein family)